MRIAIFLILAAATNSCSNTYVLKNEYLYEDKNLHKKILKNRDLLKNKKNPKIQDVNEILNDYESYREKVHTVISNNNKKAVKK